MSLKAANKIETNKYELEIEITAEDFEAAVEKAYQQSKKKIALPGFRAGKAPRKMIEKSYGEGVFYEDAINSLYPVAVNGAVDESKLVLVDRPDVEVVSVSKEDGVVMKAVCITVPEVEVSGYKGIDVEKIVKTVTDDMVSAEIEKLREKGVRIITVDDRAAQTGDDVVIDFDGYVDGIAFQGGKAEEFSLSLGSGKFIPGFEEQVAGHSIGEEFDITVSFPEDYQAEELKGKEAVFKIKLHEIKAKELPELDDDFVKDTSEFDTVEQLKDDIRKKLEEAAEKAADSEVEAKLIDTVIENMKAEIPEIMFERRVDEMVSDFEHRLSQQGMTLDIYLQYTGMEKDAFRKTFEEQAHKQVKLRLALEKIAEVENIEVSDAEADEEFEKLAQQYKMEVEKIKNYINISDLKKDIAVGKSVEFIRAQANIK
ncbi:MAG: trigger factor [Oscillospiraceae bacterium]|jgi:trigger factor